MRARLVLSAVVILAAAAGGCQRRAEKAETPQAVAAAPAPKAPVAPAIEVPAGFRHEAGFAATGYYMPARTIQVGNYQLSNITLGSPSDFTEWEGGRRAGEFGPVMVQFDDVSSPMQANEMGGENHSVNVRVLPTAYTVDSHTLAFAGAAAGVGPVVVQVRFDQEALHHALDGGEGASTPVAHGVLMVAGRRFENVSFTYFAGD